GTLPNDFTQFWLRVLPINREAKTVEMAPGVVVPLDRPFFGTMGVAPPVVLGRISSGPPGVVAGSLLTFIPAIGDFINADIIGARNPEVAMVGNVIQRLFLNVNDFPSAAALGFVLAAGTMLLVGIYTMAVGTDRLTT
ncbi:MAG TPA: hypothetical protein VFY43_00035, partial [Candidatus Limnocylindria bacterium]|nr:hypothetical protein [Candidatus Limnocylindria bacterium]